MIRVVATITLKPTMKPFYLKQLWAVVPTVRAEHGCIEYEIMEDLPMGLPPQQKTPADTVIIMEKWEDETSLRTHLGAPHMVDMRARAAAAVDTVKLQIFTAAGGAD